jgi:hypothetical protein
MKTFIFAGMLVVFASSASYSNYSMLTCTAESGTVIQVYLNGKLVNKRPNEVVRWKSKDGCNSISVTVFNTSQKSNFSLQRDIEIESGYEVFFKIVSNECGSLLVTSRRYPLLNTYSYSKKLYTRRFIS